MRIDNDAKYNRATPGVAALWSSQAGGCTRSKSGTILAFIPSHASAQEAIAKHAGKPVYDPHGEHARSACVPASKIKGLLRSATPRYLVAVPRLRKGTGEPTEHIDYYLPLASVINRRLGLK